MACLLVSDHVEPVGDRVAGVGKRVCLDSTIVTSSIGAGAPVAKITSGWVNIAAATLTSSPNAGVTMPSGPMPPEPATPQVADEWACGQSMSM